MATAQQNLDTLIIKGLPKNISFTSVQELMKHFGTNQVKEGSYFGLGNAWLAKFSTVQDAHYALHRLHQLQVFGNRLCVEFADFSFLDPPSRKREVEESARQKQDQEIFQQIHGISPSLGLKYPIPPTLKYLYPPPSPSIITNIASTLVAVPKFYTQVLHLMNKMNLPNPFAPVTSYPPVNFVALTTLENEEATDVEMEEGPKEDTETEESEIESDGDARVNLCDIIPEIPKFNTPKKKRRVTSLAMPPLRPLMPSIVNKERKIAVEEVFETQKEPAVKVPFQIRLQPNVSFEASEKITETSTSEGFGTFAPPTVPQDGENGEENGEEAAGENQDFITRKELQENRAREEDMHLLPAFRNYLRGEPSARLYVKNLAKDVKEMDLRYIYGRYVIWTSAEESNMFDVRLLTEGRMRGQAFVTLPSISRAEQALEETNGYILYSKPLVVQFARSAKPK